MRTENQGNKTILIELMLRHLHNAVIQTDFSQTKRYKVKINPETEMLTIHGNYMSIMVRKMCVRKHISLRNSMFL